MKKSILFILAIVLTALSLNAKAQTCSSQILKPYNGPKTTDELSSLLWTSTNPVIRGIDSATKVSLIKYVAFYNGFPKSMNGTDDNIQTLYRSGAFAQIFSAIIGWKVNMCTYETLPVAISMSVDDFMKLYNADPTKMAFEPELNWCSNCYNPGDPTGPTSSGDGIHCCQTPSNHGCSDPAIWVPNGGGWYIVR